MALKMIKDKVFDSNKCDNVNSLFKFYDILWSNN